MYTLKRVYLYLFWWLTIPHLVYFKISQNKKIKADLQIWRASYGEIVKSIFCYKKDSDCVLLIYLLLFVKEFRNIFYKRVGGMSVLLYFLPSLRSLYINTDNEHIGGGLYIEHGFSTIINAKSIGNNCRISQQVTIGSSVSKSIGSGEPIIGDNVTIYAGALVLGKITIGNDSIVGGVVPLFAMYLPIL